MDGPQAPSAPPVVSVPPAWPGSTGVTNRAPSVSGAPVFTVTGRRLVARDSDEAAELWSVPLPRDGGVSTPVTIDGLVLVSNSDNTPVCS